MASAKHSKAIKPLNAPASLSVWQKVQDAEHGELYAFSEDLTFSYPAISAKVMATALAQSQSYLAQIGEAAVLGLDALGDAPECLTVHLTDEVNFVRTAMTHVQGILRGHAFYRPYMEAKPPKDGYGERLISVRVEGVMVSTEQGANVFFNVKLLAIERNKRTRQFTIVQVIDLDESPVNSLTPPVLPTEGDTISTTLGDRYDSPPLDADISFLPTEPVPGDDHTH